MVLWLTDSGLGRQIAILAMALICPWGWSAEWTAMTYNLRVPVDPSPLTWPERAPKLIGLIDSQSPDFLGVQEATPDMVKHLATRLEGYQFVGRGREKEGRGEGNQIFYRASLWTLDSKDFGNLQISPTPTIEGSNGWNFQWPRMITWGRFKRRDTGEFLYVYNTHFPLVESSQYKAGDFVAKTIAARSHPEDPVILLGDFNACLDDMPIRNLLAVGVPVKPLRDTYLLVDAQKAPPTFHVFGKDFSRCKIDFIFSDSPQLVVSTHVISTADAQLASDHFPVIARFKSSMNHAN